MTWFSSILINPQKREGRKLLGNRQLLHKAVLQAFPPGSIEGAGKRVLWRLDQDGLKHTLYMVSPIQPDLTHIAEKAGWVSQAWNSISYDAFLDRLLVGQEWGFRLHANPVKQESTPAGSRGKILPHVTPEQQIQWLSSRSDALGFRVKESSESITGLIVDVSSREDLRFARKDPRQGGRSAQVALRKAQFDGVLKVTDAELLKAALTQGIGRGKAYGCGLLTLRKAG